MTSLGYLLDVNFLVALAWPNHVSHVRARAWFLNERSDPFVTCPITESGFVRISMNPLVVTEQVSMASAIEILERYRTRYPHQFWSDDLTLAEALAPFRHLTGHRQITDAYLLSLAINHQGRLVTFDKGIRALPDAERLKNLLILE